MPPEKNDSPGDWTRAVREAGPYLGMGLTMAVTLLLGLGLGYWVDGLWGTRPIFILVGGGFGLVAALGYFVRAAGTGRP